MASNWRLIIVAVMASLMMAMARASSGLTASMASLEQNGYTNIVVAIDEKVPEDDCLVLLDNLKNGFKEASRILLPALHFKAYFKTVKIVLPESWRREECLRDSVGFATRPLITGADFRVAQPNPVHGDDPYTIQPHGCGKRGLYTHLTPGFLKNTNAADEEAKKGTIARALVQEWAKLRYGVYEEYGYPGDSMYPHFYTTYHGNWTKEMRPTGCSNRPVLGTRNCSGNSCVFYPSVADNGNVTSSLMYLRNLPNVTHFCNSKTHVKEAPTKHNVLCHGKDVDSIISSNDDFKDVFEVTAPVGDTDFEVLRASNRRIVFALDRSNATSEQNVWSALGPRLYGLLHVLNKTNPDIEIGIVEFDGDRSETKSRGGMRIPAGFLDRSPPITTYEYLTDSPAGCIDCGLSEAWKLLRARSQRVDGMEIVVLTRQLKPVNLDKLVAQFRNAGIILHAIVVEEGPSTKYDDVERAAIATNGRVFRIKYGDTFVRTGANIAEAFEALFPSVKRTRVYEKFLDPKTAPNSSVMTGNFTLETDGRSTAIAPYMKTGSDLDVFLFFYQTLVALDVPRQFVAEGKVGGFRQVGYKPVGEFPMFLAHFASDAARDGEYQYKFSPGLKREEYLIEAHGHYDKAAGTGTGLKFEVWTSWDHLSETDLQDPLIVETTPLKLYAKVEKDGKPVFDARVWAVVTIKREHEEDFSDTRTLVDDGRGDPDIQRGDGVYTAYFTNFVTATSISEYRFVFACDDNGGHARVPSDNQRKSAFEYGFEYFKQAAAAAGANEAEEEPATTTGAPVALSERQVAARSLPADEGRRAEDYWDANGAPRPLSGTAVSSRTGTSSCCGSEPVDLMLEPSGSFSSFANGKLETITFHVPATSGSLIFPPSRIMDLKVDVYDGPGVFRLSWSAPGDEYTVGTVSQYVVAYGENWDSVAYYQDGVKTFIAPLTPQTYGSAESLDVNATDLNLLPGVVYFFSLRGCDQASKCGIPSNVILASLSPLPDPELGGSSSAPGLSGLPSNKLGGLSTAETFGIAFGCIGFLVLAAAGWCVYLVYCRRRKNDPSAAKAALARKGLGSASSGSISNNNGIRHSTPSAYSASNLNDDDPKGHNGEISTISNGQVGSPSYVPASQLLGPHEKRTNNGDIYGTTGYPPEGSVYGNNKDATMESGIVDDPHMGYMPDQPQQDPYVVAGGMPEYNYDPSYYYAGENQGYDAADMSYAQGYPGYENTYGQQPTWYQQQHLQQPVQQGSGRSSRHSDSTTTNSIPSNSRYEAAGYADQHYNGYADGAAMATEQLYARPNKMPPSANTSYDHLQMAGSRHSSVSHQTPPASGTTPRVRNITQV